MMADGYEKLLASLNASPPQAEEAFERLRRLLIRVLSGRGARYPEDLADETLSRVAGKLAAGKLVENIPAYSLEVARRVWYESLRDEGKDREIDPDGDWPADDDKEEKERKERRSVCLDDCKATLPPESRYLITEYYSYSGRQLIELRRELAEQFGLTREALANRAQRLRHKLEACILNCEKKKTI